MTGETERVEILAEALEARGVKDPQVGVVLGSGLSPLEELLGGARPIPYGELPGVPSPAVEGHGGKVLFGERAGTRLALLCGRIHLYEGYGPAEVVRLVRALAFLGCPLVVLTNAAGGVREDLEAGDLMLLSDQVNLQGRNPFLGPLEPRLGPRFPDQTRVYDPEVRRVLSGASPSGPLPEGVYLGNLGPLYETPAEIRMARALGADAVGMSTVQEASALSALGVRVGGISVIANKAAGLAGTPLTHEDVVAAVKGAAGKLADLLERALPGLAALGRKEKEGDGKP